MEKVKVWWDLGYGGGLGMTGSQGGDWGLGGLGGGGVLACIPLKLHKLDHVVSKNLIVY